MRQKVGVLQPVGGAHTPPLHFMPLPQSSKSALPSHGGGAGTVAVTQLPPRQAPPGQGVPSGFLPLHLPCLRFLQGWHFFLASVSARPTRPSVPPNKEASAVLRE